MLHNTAKMLAIAALVQYVSALQVVPARASVSRAGKLVMADLSIESCDTHLVLRTQSL